MKAFITLLFIIISISVNAQESSGGGKFPNYQKLGIMKVEEYYFSLENRREKDSLPKRTLFFNNRGEMIKEQFNQYLSQPFYSFDYNNEGFLIDIDTNGMFVYGYSSPGSPVDTVYNQYNIEENWFSIDTIRRLQIAITYSHTDSLYTKKENQFDSLGRTTKEIYSYKKPGEQYIVAQTVTYEYSQFNLLSRIIRKDEENNHISAIEEFKYFFSNSKMR